MSLIDKVKNKLHRSKEADEEYATTEEVNESDIPSNEEIQETKIVMAGKEKEVENEPAGNSDMQFTDETLDKDNVKIINKKRVALAAMVALGLGFGAPHIWAMISPDSPPAQTQEHVDQPTASGQSPADGIANTYVKQGEAMKQAYGEQTPSPDGMATSNQKTSNDMTTASSNTPSTTVAATQDTAPYVATEPTTMAPQQSTQTATGSNNKGDEEARERIKEQQRIAMSPIAFKVAADITQGKPVSGPNAAPYQTATGQTTNTTVTSQPAPIYLDEQPQNSVSEQHVLLASSVIPATLLTGISTDIPNNQIVAVVRQNVYDSLTGKHLLIPQGSRIIGHAGNQGGKGVKRVGVVFERVIMPNGSSISLPNATAIDGTGMPGMKDKYDEHINSIFKTAFMSSLVGAMAQTSTGDTSGDDTRSPGQEAVSGAVAQIQNAAANLVNQASNQQATIEIRPGKAFNIYIPQDLLIPEYQK